MTEEDKWRLATFHQTISEQLNARLSESPKFFAVLVVVSTGYGYVLLTLDAERELGLFVLTSLLAYGAVLWSLWYLAALGYAFRYLQRSQHLIEDDLDWARYRTKTTGRPSRQVRTLGDLLWLLPGIYHAHAFGLMIFLALIVGAFSVRLWPRCLGVVAAVVALVFGGGWVYFVNRHYLERFKAARMQDDV